jgi:hypothetical protein
LGLDGALPRRCALPCCVAMAMGELVPNPNSPDQPLGRVREIVRNTQEQFPSSEASLSAIATALECHHAARAVVVLATRC